MQQFISLSELQGKQRKVYKCSQSLIECVCGQTKRRVVDLSDRDDKKNHLYQYICTNCGRKSEPQPYKTLAIISWNEMQKREREKE